MTTQKRNQTLRLHNDWDQLRTVSWGNDSNRPGVVKPVYGIPTFPLTAKDVQSKGNTFKNVYIILLIKNNAEQADLSGETISVR